MRPFRSRRAKALATIASLLIIAGVLAIVGVTGNHANNPATDSWSTGHQLATPGVTATAVERKMLSTATDLNGTPETSSASQTFDITTALPLVATTDRFLVRTGHLTIVVARDSTNHAVAQIIGATQGYGGYVLSSFVGTIQPGQPYPVTTEKLQAPDATVQSNQSLTSVEGGDPYAEITVRIPARQFDAAVARFSKLGTVSELTTSADDVTSQMVDLQARLTHYRAVLARLLTFLDKADTVGAALAVQNRIDQTELMVEQITAEMKQMQETVSYSTLAVSLSERAAKPAVYSGTTGFWGSLKHSLALIGDGARYTFLGIGAALPFLALGVAVIAILIFSARAASRRRARGSNQPTPPNTGTPPTTAPTVGENAA